MIAGVLELLIMNTPTHVIFNTAVLNPKTRKNFWYAILGGILPDLLLYSVTIFIIIMGYDLMYFFDVSYFQSPFKEISALTHSLILYPILYLLAKFVFKKDDLSILFLSCIIHIVADFFLHAKDAYMHFWPITNWKFSSPISYWDPNYYGNYFILVEVIITLIATYFVTKRLNKTWHKIAFWAFFGLYAILGLVAFYFLNFS
jgi:hypothetical protein